jgi:hypothetical protein
MNWSSFFLAHRIKAKLRNGTVGESYENFRVTGKLDTPAVLAAIDVRVSRSFEKVLAHPPRVRCLESWMRSGPDWHNDLEAGMCWVLADEWRDVFSQRGRNEGEVIRVASDWLIHNVTSLVSRHYCGHLHGMRRWPAEWNAWDHYEGGVAQYKAEQDKRTREETAG